MRRPALCVLSLVSLLGLGSGAALSDPVPHSTSAPARGQKPNGLWSQRLQYHADTLRVLDGSWKQSRERTFIEIRKNSTRFRFGVHLALAVSPALDQWLMSGEGGRRGWHAGYDYVDEATGTLWLSVGTGPHDQFGWVNIDLRSAEVLSSRLDRSRYDYADDLKRVYDDLTNDVLIDLRNDPDLQGLEISMLAASPDNAFWAALALANDSSRVIWWNSRVKALHRLPLPASARPQMIDWSCDGTLLCAGYMTDGDVGVSVFRRSGDTLMTPPMAKFVIEGPWQLGRLQDRDRPLPPMWLDNGATLGLRLSHAHLWDNNKGERYFPWGEGDSVAVFSLEARPERGPSK